MFLTVFAVTAVAQAASFRNGVNGYWGIEDTLVRRDSSREEWNGGGAEALQMHGQSDDYYPYKATLIRFNDIFGNGPNEVPYGQNLQSAILRLYLYNEGVGGGTSKEIVANPMLFI